MALIGENNMDRCEYCAYRNCWECDDGWGRTPNDTFCNEFKLDVNTLTYKQQKAIQKILMNNAVSINH